MKSAQAEPTETMRASFHAPTAEEVAALQRQAPPGWKVVIVRDDTGDRIVGQGTINSEFQWQLWASGLFEIGRDGMNWKVIDLSDLPK